MELETLPNQMQLVYPSREMGANEALELIEKAVQNAEDYQAHLEHNKESLKMMKIVEKFLRLSKRLLYGGFAINALLPKKDKFYDPQKELPDFDFLTPDPFTDVAQLIQMFSEAGYTEVETNMGIHEGTYKVFVNFQGVADITLCDPVVYERLEKEAVIVDSLHICPPNYLRMNIFSELSHPAGDVSRWMKVYKRFLLLNKAYPFQECNGNHQVSEILPSPSLSAYLKSQLYSKFIKATYAAGDVLMGIPDVSYIFANPDQTSFKRARTVRHHISHKGPFLLLALSNSPLESAEAILQYWQAFFSEEELSLREVNAVGEVLPNRVEIVYKDLTPLCMIFQTVSCHAYYDVDIGRKQMHIASIDTLLYFYFGFYYANITYPGHDVILCLCKRLLELADAVRVKQNQPWPFPTFAVKCLGYQPTLAELKREHRERVKVERAKKRAELRLRRSIKAASIRLVSKKATNKTRKVKKVKTKD